MKKMKLIGSEDPDYNFISAQFRISKAFGYGATKGGSFHIKPLPETRLSGKAL